jgi:isocitrate/isopropylmalate dehydrogenase
MTPRIVVLPGDGIGPEVIDAAMQVAEAAGLDAEWIHGRVGWEEWCGSGSALPAETLQLLDETDACLFGAITSRPVMEAEAALPVELRGTGHRYVSPILQIRRAKGLHLNLRPNRFWAGVSSPLRDAPTGATITILRENSEDLYVGAEAHPVSAGLDAALTAHLPGYAPFAARPRGEVAVSTRVTTRTATRRLMESAFSYAAIHGHTQVTLAEKANVLRATGGLVLEEAQAVAARHPTIELVVANVDALAAELVTRPTAHPVIAATNLFGDILSDIAAAVTGGLGLAASANIGDAYALFEPIHGSAPDIAGTDTANPIAAVLSAAHLARYLGRHDVAERIEAAVAALLHEGALRTPDLGGDATTTAITQSLIEQIERTRAIASPPTQRSTVS